jgi:hypothetical protein
MSSLVHTPRHDLGKSDPDRSSEASTGACHPRTHAPRTGLKGGAPLLATIGGPQTEALSDLAR